MHPLAAASFKQGASHKMNTPILTNLFHKTSRFSFAEKAGSLQVRAPAMNKKLRQFSSILVDI